MRNFLKSSYMGIILLFIYVPIVILILFSFNNSDSMGIFTDFSDRWYHELSQQQSFLQSIIISVFTAVIATLVSTILGTLAAIGLSRARKVTQKMTLSITNIPLINADIITAVSLIMLFIALGVKFGFLTLVLAHISFDVPYVIITVLPRLRKIDPRLIEASLDLGAKPSQTLWKIILPILKPAIISAAAIAFAMSFDDFIISYFTGGDDVNVTTFIYTMKRIKPFVNAFGTICIAIIGFVIIGWNGWNIYKASHEKFRKEMLKGTYKDKTMLRYEMHLAVLYHSLNNQTLTDEKVKERLRTKIIYWEDKYAKGLAWAKNKKNNFILKEERRETISEISRNKFRWFTKTWKPITLVIICAGSISLLTGVYITNNIYDLVVANWSGYIADSVLNGFQQKYHVKVKYVVYDSNETLYNKLYTTKYDVMVPSDYMVAKLGGQGDLAKIDYTKLNAVDPNFHLVKPNPNFDGNIAGYDVKFNQWFNDKNVDVNYYQSNDIQFYNNCINTNDKKPPASCFDKNKTVMVNNGLLGIQNKNKIASPAINASITDYNIPLFWGDMSLVIRPSADNIAFIQNILNEENKNLPGTIAKFGISEQAWTADRQQYVINDVYDPKNVTYSNGISWDILWKAAQAGKRVLLNNDYKNLFMIASEKNRQQVLPTTQQEIDQDFNDLKTLLKYNNVALKNDEIINDVGDGRFDFAFMYNGDAIIADAGDNGEGGFANSGQAGSDHKLLITHPRFAKYNATQQKFTNIEGTNIWSDNFVITKNSRHQNLAYKFINYVIQHQSELTENAGYTSPYQQVMDYEINPVVKPGDELGPMLDYNREYVPVSKWDSTLNNYISDPIAADGPFYNGSLDDYLVNKYNILIASKN